MVSQESLAWADEHGVAPAVALPIAERGRNQFTGICEPAKCGPVPPTTHGLVREERRQRRGPLNVIDGRRPRPRLQGGYREGDPQEDD